MPVGSYALLKVKATPVVASRRFFDFISETPGEQSIEEDSLFADDAVFVGKSPSDMAENHDRNLYGETE